MGYRRRMIILIMIDFIFIWFSIFTSYYLRFTGNIPQSHIRELILYGTVSTVLCLACMFYFKLYNRIWEYASIGEILSIVKAVTIGCVLAYVVTLLIQGHRIPTSIAIRTFETTLLTIGGVRFVWRVLRDSYTKHDQSKSRTLVIGAGDCGTMIVKELKHTPSSTLYPYAFIDDDRAKHKMQVHGIPVVGGRDTIVSFVKEHGIEDIIIAIPSATRSELLAIIEECKKTTAKLKIIPRIRDLIHGKVTINEIRNVEVEDLLGRDPITVDLEGIASYVKNTTVLVTGAGGSIGSELSRQLAKYNPKQLIILDHSENYIYAIDKELQGQMPATIITPIIADIKDRDRMEAIFQQYKPQVVFHAAAHKHVPLMEDNVAEALKNNVFGTKNVAELADHYRVERFVLISTDKAVNPTSVMGTTKRIAEMIVQNLGKTSETKFAAVRFGNVLGSNGSVIPLFKQQIAKGGPVTVTDPEMIRYFMTIPEAVELVIQAGAYVDKNELFILDMGEPVRILDLAKDLIRLSGFEPFKDIDIQFTGVRPGEKLFEELLTDEEGLTSTMHDRIFITRVHEDQYIDIEHKLNILQQAMIHGDREHIIQAMKHAVKEYETLNGVSAQVAATREEVTDQVKEREEEMVLGVVNG